MRQDTLWQEGRREARLHWWQEVLDRPGTAAKRDEVFDEVLSMRFRGASDAEFPGTWDAAPAGWSWA